VLSVVEGHTGAATAASLDGDVLRATARRARAAAEVSARSGAGGYPGLPEPRGGHGAAGDAAPPDPATARAALEGAFATTAEHGLAAYGMWTAGDVETAIAASTGLSTVDRVTDAYLKVVARDEDGRSGFSAAAGRGPDALDGVAVARRAVSGVARSQPATLEPGEYAVVLDHDAVGTLLDMLALVGFNGLAHAEGRGALSGRLGERVAAPAIDIVDDPGARLTLPRAFDAEGVPKAPLGLIEDGVARAVAHDTRSAAVAGDGARTTGHAIEPGGSPHGAAPTNLVLRGGDAASVDELAAPIERGLYVRRLWYVNPVHERSALLTGVTRDGTFLIEDGRIAGPARDVRFTDSALRILEATEALTAQQTLVSEADFYGVRFAFGQVVPALRARGFRITGGT
jgi:predicted Zn-dependent protease